jgi:FkbM family methyltransferase
MVTFKEAYARMAEAAYKSGYGDLSKEAGFKPFNNKLSQAGGAFLYGCGEAGRIMAYKLGKSGVPIYGVCDGRLSGIFPITGQVIMTPEELRIKHSEHPDAMIMISTGKEYEREIADKLACLGFADSQVLFFSETIMLWFPATVTPEEFAAKHYAGYEWAYGELGDDQSKRTLLDRVRVYLTGEPMPLSSHSPNYFERGLIELSEGEVFVDCGAFEGETALLFAEEAHAAGIRDWRVYSFDANPEKHDRLKANLGRFSNIEIVNKGLWSAESELTFYVSPNSGSSSFLTDDSNFKKITVPVTSLDVFFGDRPRRDRPTFIKMDIEGAEAEALRGGGGDYQRVAP